jgi:hypothetical protein
LGVTLAAFACFALTALVATPAEAGCGCQKAPPELASVRPNATYPGSEVTVFGPALQSGQSYSVQFVSGTTGASTVVNTVAVNRRDLADGVYRPQLVVALPNLPLGPTRIVVSRAGNTVQAIGDEALTVVPAPVALSESVGTSNYPGYRAAIGRDGTFYVSLNLSGVTMPRIFRAQAKGYPLVFTSDDVVFYNTQGFLMQLLGNNMPGLYSVESSNSTVDSDVLGYSRHEFNTFYLQHEERQVHEVVDGNWHANGTRHVDHDHLILAIAGVLHNGTMPAPGATPPFTLSLETQSLFDNALTVTGDAAMSGTVVVDAYAAATDTFETGGNVFANGKISMSNRATIDGNATASSFNLSGSSQITGMQSAPNPPVTLMAVKVPDLLPDLGDIDVAGTETLTGPGSFLVGDLGVGDGTTLFVDNSAGPVTLYVTGQLKLNGGTIELAHADPEWFAIYVASNRDVSLSGGGVGTEFNGVVYAPQSKLSLSGDGEFFGSFVGAELGSSGGSQIHYDLALQGGGSTPPPTATPSTASTPAPTPTSTPAAACAVNPNGTYVDAEKFSGRVNTGAPYSFAGMSSAQAGFVGTGYLKTGATQNQLSYSNVNSAPGSYERYDYQLNFPTTGTYTVWIRGWSANSNENSIYIGLDGTAVGALTELTYGVWNWTKTIYNGTNTVTVATPGLHTIHLWPREYNHLLDGFYLTKTTTVPSGGIPSGATVYGQGCNG